MHMTLNIHILAWDRQKNVSGINRLMEYLSPPLDNCISNGNIYTNNKTICTDSFPLKTTTYYYKYERPHRHGQYDSRVNECLKLIGHQLGRQNLLVKYHYSQHSKNQFVGYFFLLFNLCRSAGPACLQIHDQI